VTFKVRLTRDAEADLDRLFDFLVERELARDSGDLELPEQAMTALRAGIATLKSSPFTCRKAGNSPFLRELIIHSGDRATSRCSKSKTSRLLPSSPYATNSKTTTTELTVRATHAPSNDCCLSARRFATEAGAVIGGTDPRKTASGQSRRSSADNAPLRPDAQAGLRRRGLTADRSSTLGPGPLGRCRRRRITADSTNRIETIRSGHRSRGSVDTPKTAC